MTIQKYDWVSKELQTLQSLMQMGEVSLWIVIIHHNMAVLTALIK